MHPGCQLCASVRWGSGIRAWGEEEENFSHIETSKCERSTAWGRFKAQAKSPNTCSTVLLAVSQFWCFKWVHKQSSDGLTSSGLMEMQREETARVRLWTSTPSSLWVLLHIKVEGRRKWNGRSFVWKSKCFTDSREDVLRRTQQGAPASCQQAKLVLLL